MSHENSRTTGGVFCSESSGDNRNSGLEKNQIQEALERTKRLIEMILDEFNCWYKKVVIKDDTDKPGAMECNLDEGQYGYYVITVQKGALSAIVDEDTVTIEYVEYCLHEAFHIVVYNYTRLAETCSKRKIHEELRYREEEMIVKLASGFLPMAVNLAMEIFDKIPEGKESPNVL